MKANLFFVLLFLQLFQLRPMFGEEPSIFKYDKTAYFERLFADGSEFDIRTFKAFPTLEPMMWHVGPLFQYVQPAPGYVYWEYRYYDGNTPYGKVVYKRGYRCPVPLIDSTFLAASPGRDGFFPGVLTSSCSHIVAVREDGTVDLIDNEERLVEFLGAVDNLVELRLHLSARGYEVNEETLITGAYKEEEDRYLLYLAQIVSDWRRCDESVKAILYKDGRRFEEVSRVRYRQWNTVCTP